MSLGKARRALIVLLVALSAGSRVWRRNECRGHRFRGAFEEGAVEREADPGGSPAAGAARQGALLARRDRRQVRREREEGAARLRASSAVAKFRRSDRGGVEGAADGRPAGDHELYPHRTGRRWTIPAQASIENGGYAGHSQTRLHQLARRVRRKIPHERGAACGA